MAARSAFQDVKEFEPDARRWSRMQHGRLILRGLELRLLKHGTHEDLVLSSEIMSKRRHII